jgi:cyclopropane fatty-acyl-phospholipid synthase-like methyltransferase
VALSDLFSRRRKDDPEPDASAAKASPAHPSKALKKFVATLGAHPQPTLLDIGPVVGHNVTFFGERLGCKFQVEELSKDIDRHVREDKLGELPEFFNKRFPQPDETFDGILCWDLFDYLDKNAAQALARQLSRLLRPGGVIFALFNATLEPPATKTYTRFFVVDETSIQYRPYSGARAKQRPLQNRDIQRIFEPLRITDQFLLKTNIREVLFRK